MIKFELTPHTIEKIEMYEAEYLNECISVIEFYRDLFLNYGCEINYSIFWSTKKCDKCLQRPPFEKNYVCWFGYEVLKNGQCVCLDPIEGETLGDSEGFLFIRKKKTGIFKRTILEVTYVEGTGDLRESLEKNHSILKQLYAN